MKSNPKTMLTHCVFRLAKLNLVFVCLACVASGCSKTSTAPSTGSAEAPTSNLKGNIEVGGSSTVAPISNAMAELFGNEYPDVNVNVVVEGTGIGFQNFAEKKRDITGASRPIKPTEQETLEQNGVEFLELPVAYDGLTFVVHPDNDWVTEMNVDQLKKIFVTDQAVNKWNEVDPSWPDSEIKIFAPGTGSGTYDYTREVLAGKSGTLREDMSLNEDDNVLVTGVAGNKYSIGFFGVAYYEENKDRLRAVPIINPDDGKAYEPTAENIAGSKYAPFSRPLFIYVNLESLDKAEVETYVDYYLSNASKVAEDVDYVRLPENLQQESREILDNRTTGAHFAAH